VTNFEFTDESREEGFAPGTKRRLMARIWYPAAKTEGEPRLLFTDSELDHFAADFNKVIPMDKAVVDARRGVQTFSYPDAPIATDQESYPLLVFSHGGFSHPNQNTALMEHLASHGYIVMSVAHPFLASGLIYPNGDLVRLDEKLAKDFTHQVFNTNYMDMFMAPDKARRLEELYIQYDSFVLAPHFIVWRDDMIAAVDVIESGEVPSNVQPIAKRVDLNRLGYFGMSFGACGAAAAHKDLRAKAAVNIDGGNWDIALVDAEVRVPALILHNDDDLALASLGMEGEMFPHSSFVYERLETFGDREDVVRVMTVGSTHTDYTDRALIPEELREISRTKGEAGSIDGMRMIHIMNDWVKAFFDRYVLDDEAAFPADLYERYPEVTQLDMSDIKEWANARKR
jgi:predicted dienelactone hydrolase